MVTTRSADKRLDASRAEDLVLRSRTIGSPSSVASTPSQSQKRTASARENTDGLRSKRVRTESSGAATSKTTHIVVNIPVISVNRGNQSIPDGSANEHSQERKAKANSDNESATGDDKDQTTPDAKVISVAETPDQGDETFKTPATSRHKRFDSEELDDDDTIIVSNAIDSSAPQGYQTAEEEITDSDDDGEAPDVESTKIAPKMPMSKSERTTGAKKQSAFSLNTVDVDDETIEVAPSQTETESLTIGRESFVSGDSLDEAASVKEPGEETSQNTSLIASTLEPAPSQVTISSGPLTHSTLPSLPSGEPNYTDQIQVISPARSREIVPLDDADAESITVSDSTLQDLSLTDRDTTSEIKHTRGQISGPVRKDLFPHVLGRSAKIQIQKSGLAPTPGTIRLPVKATSSLSDYRRRNFQQKVAGSAGGFKMQTDWANKRGSFVVS